MKEEIRLPFEIDEKTAKDENIHPLIISPPTEEEWKKVKAEGERIKKYAESMLKTKPEWIDINLSQRAEEIYKNELFFLTENYDVINPVERDKRFRAAFVNLTEALIRQGKLFDAIEVAWQGHHIGADTIKLLQMATDYVEAINRPDDDFCNCGDVVIEQENRKVFGDVVTVEVLPTLNVVGSVPSYKHNGEIADIVRCSICGRLNAVPRNVVPVSALDISRASHPTLPTRRIKNANSIPRTIPRP